MEAPVQQNTQLVSAQPFNPPTALAVVDDDPRLLELLQQYLSQEGFVVHTARSGAALNTLLGSQAVDLIVLDWMMPQEDGIAVCKRLRTMGDQTPILMLTALDEDEHRIQGLDAGADDFLAKPFNPRELLLRIRAVLRRTKPLHPLQLPNEIKFGSCSFFPALKQLAVNAQAHTLTETEFQILKVFTQHPKELLSRERLAILVKGKPLDAFDRSLDVQVSHLRKLIEPDPAKPQHIRTVWGKGYEFHF